MESVSSGPTGGASENAVSQALRVSLLLSQAAVNTMVALVSLTTDHLSTTWLMGSGQPVPVSPTGSCLGVLEGRLVSALQ